MTAEHPGIATDMPVRIARADAVEHLLGGAEALLEGAATTTPVEALALRKADALRDAAFAAGLRWAAAQARTRGLDRFSVTLAEEAEEIVMESRRVTAVTESPNTAAPRARAGHRMKISSDSTLSVYASPGCLTVSAVDGRVLAVDDPTGRLQALAIEQVDLDGVSLFPALNLNGQPLEMASLGFWRRLGGRRCYTLPPLQAA